MMRGNQGCGMVVGASSATAVLTALFMTVLAPDPETLQVKELEVVNERGVVVARIGSMESGGILRLYDENGKQLVRLAAHRDGGRLDMQARGPDESGGHPQAVSLQALPDGGRLVFTDPSGQVAMKLEGVTGGSHLQLRHQPDGEGARPVEHVISVGDFGK